MKVRDLIYNDGFSFNVEYRILKYLGFDLLKVMYDSRKDRFPKHELLDKYICAINQNGDVIDIEYSDLAYHYE